MYHYFPRSVYCLLNGKIYYKTGVNSKLAFTKRERKPVFITTVTKILCIISLTSSEFVSLSMNLTKLYITFLTKMFTIQIKTVIKFEIKYPFQNSF